ncbi:MAG: transcriptional repressor [Thermoprotei archaeon]|nr:MAG: transcriptional repressor [Thermoprotei archaeon]
MSEESQIFARLREEGYKLTPQRYEIIKIIMSKGRSHPSLNSLYSLIKERMPTVSFSTLYGTVMKLVELGFLKVFDLNGETRIEVNTSPHINLVHLSSGEVIDISEPEIVESLRKSLGLGKKDFLVNILIYD